MEQVVEVPVVQTLRDTEGELIQESHWVNRWKGYINTSRRQTGGFCAFQLYVAVIYTYGRCCPHHLLNSAMLMSVWEINTVSVAFSTSDIGHIVSTWQGSHCQLTCLYSDVVRPCLDVTLIITQYATPCEGIQSFAYNNSIMYTSLVLPYCPEIKCIILI